MSKQNVIINPFRPTAGAEPPVLIGREKVVEDFKDGLIEGVGAPARLMRITGPRGSGKTVLLTELGDLAAAQDWRVVDVTAKGSIVKEIIHELERGERRGSLGVEANLGVVKVTANAPVAGDETLRDICTRIARELTEVGTGLLITVDEIQDANPDDVRDVATTVQHLIREKLNIAFVFAGLTTGVLDLINGRALTFLRRAKSEELAAIPIDGVAASFKETIEKAGLRVDADALELAAEATKGYAYLIQLVGYEVFAAGRRHAESSRTITVGDAKEGIREARKAFADAVQELAVSGISERAMNYLVAMAGHEGNVSTADIAAEMEMAPASLTTTRRQLIKKQVIEAPSRGVVRFAIPYMREFILENKEELFARY